MKHPSFSVLRALLFTMLACLPLLSAHAQTAVWTNNDDRNAYAGDPNNYLPFWSYGYVPPDVNGKGSHAGNWSGFAAPGGGGPRNAYLGAPGDTLCDVRVSLDSLTIAAGGALNLDTSSSLTVSTTDIERDGTMTEGGYAGGQAGTFTNAGTLAKSAGAGIFTFQSSIFFSSAVGSTIGVASGTLQLPGGGGLYDTVTFNPAAGTLIDLMTQGSSLFQGKLNDAGTGTVRFSAGLMDGTQRSYVQNPQPCTLAFTGDVFQWTGGTMGGYQHGDMFTNTGIVNIAGTAAKTTDAIFTNKGTMIQTGTVGLNIGEANSGGSLTNAAGALYDMQTDAGIGQGGYSFNNLGLLKKSVGTGTSTLTVAFNNQGGTVEVDSGTLQLPLNIGHGVSTGGTFNVPGANALLDLGDSNAFTGTYTGTGSGHVRFSQGSLYTSPDGTGATFNFPAPMFQWSGGSIGSDLAHAFVNAGAMAITGSVGVSGNGLTNSGTMTQSGTGALNLPFGTGFTNNASGVYDIQDDHDITNGGGGGGNPFFNNSGTLEKSAGSGTSTVYASFNNTGSLLLESGTLAFVADFTQTAGVVNLDGGNLSSANDIVINGGIVEGTGTITGNVRNNSGIVAPGHSPGKITVTGNYTQGANGALNIQIGGNTAGSSYDQLVVSGVATLGGTLNISTIDGYRPAVGDVFTIISPQSFSGSFAQINATGLSVQANFASGAITVTVTSVPDLLLNISTRLRVLTEDKALIGGFIITGTEPKKVIIRAIGPSLSGVPGALQDPTLELFDDKSSLATNDNWRQDQEAEIQASGVAPTKDAEAAIVRTLNPGNYTAVVRGKNSSVGIGVVEVYDLAQTAKAKLANISSRGFVDTGDNALIGGFIAGGSGGGTSTKVVIRALGPSLSDQGINSVLANPTLELKDANGSTVRSNDDWKSDQQAEITALGLQPSRDAESTLIATLPAGGYTAIVRGVDNTTGVAVVEIYNVQ